MFCSTSLIVEYLAQRSDASDAAHVHGVYAFTPLLGFKFYAVVLLNLAAVEARDVHKKLLAGGVVGDETKAFGFIEKFYCSGLHSLKKKKYSLARPQPTKHRGWLG